ncbi:MAG: hypothetical protein A2X49_02645 [Lentisphaerae bacterium GWF2_52_8]|nr:MAG: hypothetical protein A2X49_02645 [Lentisphaerae bacterium GWF2_52_8]
MGGLFDREIEPGVYEIELPDDAMAPLIPAGALLHVASGLDPENGDTVLCVLRGSGRFLLREYSVSDGMVLLRAANPAHDNYKAGRSEFSTMCDGIFPVLRFVSPLPAALRWRQGAGRLLTLQETMKILKVGRSKIYQMLRGGVIPATKVGKLWRIDSKDLGAYLRGAIGR